MTIQIKQTIKEQCKKAFDSSRDLISITTEEKNAILRKMADCLISKASYILQENLKDLTEGKENGISDYLLDRLKLDMDRIKGISESIITISTLSDPIGEVISDWTCPNGLKIKKVRVPLGVIGIIYEARPNVTADAASLAFKTGNSVVLRGSSSAYRSNKAIVDTLKIPLVDSNYNSDCIQLLEDTSREGVKHFVKLNEYLSLIIPRGGAGLIQSVIKEASVPTIETGVGNCHVYVDKEANLEKAKAIVFNSKTHRPSVCNSCESLVVHNDIAQDFLPKLFDQLQSAGVEIRGCDMTKSIDNRVVEATEEDWGTEYLDLTISVKIVHSLKEAMDHITQYGTSHTEAIITQNNETAAIFSKQIDASSVLINTSTRFTDGGEFGFGSEIGISTQKLHARGPMGLPEITSYKYIVEGSGQIR